MNPTRGRTYSREQWEEAQALWRDWDASPEMRAEWRHWRHRAAMVAGIIVPPTGSRWDSWTDDHPSQLAKLTWAIREAPEWLDAAIRAPGVRSWYDVITRLHEYQGDHRDEGAIAAGREEREAAAYPTPRQATMRLGEILATIRDSVA